jgi:proteasome lid subunit RPN8/RPN11
VYFWLVQRMNTVTVSFAFVLFPIIAQFLAFMVEGIGFDWIGMLLTLVVLGAFAVTQWNQRVEARFVRSTVDADGRPAEPALAEVYRHVLASYPAEACGFIRASGVRPCANVIDDLSRDRPADFDRVSRNGYAFGPAYIRYLEQSFDGDDPVLIIYHSHPDAGAYFSDEDTRYAMFDGMPLYPVRHLVVDTGEDSVHGSRLFEFHEDRYVAVFEFGRPRDQILPSGSLE